MSTSSHSNHSLGSSPGFGPSGPSKLSMSPELRRPLEADARAANTKSCPELEAMLASAGLKIPTSVGPFSQSAAKTGGGPGSTEGKQPGSGTSADFGTTSSSLAGTPVSLIRSVSNTESSQTDSEVQPDPANPPTTLPGLSETVMNGTLYYERYGFQARVSGRYRSDFLGEVAGFGNGRTLRSVAAETVVDAQVGYEFQSGPLEGLSILAQVNNLTDEPFKTFENGDERRTIDYQHYGRTFAVGLNYKF